MSTYTEAVEDKKKINMRIEGERRDYDLRGR